MNGRIALSTFLLIMAAIGSAKAEKPPLPIGDWTYSTDSARACRRPQLTIEKDRLIQRIDQDGIRGEARCKILKIKKQLKGVLFVDTKCNWDKHVPQEMRESPDNENDDSFSLKVVSQNEILFNNMNYWLCPANPEGAR
ncbi:hypothetical protein [uncultured Methylobacterium sp.]|uniref:hypothetical protein n=1 Tax=uncultured Methylobacterium sp. TaxID=157278 RepID=UPI002593ED7E|nr:hypothetical protein [uncultured Methylobacterium sp.]